MPFFAEIGASPKSVLKKVTSKLRSTLTDSPDKGSSIIKKLTGYKNLWRMRFGDYRLVYRIDRDPDKVTLLMIGTRGSIYDRLDRGADGGPSLSIVANHPEFLEPEPEPAQIGQAAMSLAFQDVEEHEPDSPLPVELTAEKLSKWNIPEELHKHLVGVASEGDLLELEGAIDSEWHQRILDLVYPRSISEVLEQPTRLAGTTAEMEAGAAGEMNLAAFLLQLDDEQDAFLTAFDRGKAEGPWLVKGGPGSGKTVLALYAIRDVVQRARDTGEESRILFTTYTRALATAAEQLLGHLGVDLEKDRVEVINVDRLANEIGGGSGRVIGNDEEDLTKLLKIAIKNCILTDRKFPFSMKDAGFLMDEIEWIILGRGIVERDVYLGTDRPGRSRDLDEAERRYLWSLYLALRNELKAKKWRLYGDMTVGAVEKAEPTYDHVFVDEVHDLKPLSVQLCSALCKSKENVFLTLDPNQSIYGARMEWANALSDGLGTPRTALLKRNHRSTAEIWGAMRQIVTSLQVADAETLPEPGPNSGPFPILANNESPEDEAERIAAFLHESLLEERVGPGCAGVLCPRTWDCHSIAKALPKRFNPKVMSSKDLDLNHPGVKLMTMHSAKGLQFPVVVVARMDKGNIPWKPKPGIAPEDHEQLMRRLFFVACSRSMRRLMVMHKRNKPSMLLQGLDDDAWDIS